MLQVVLTVLLSLFTVGCGGPRYVDYFPCHDDGTSKPKVILMPIVNSSGTNLPWDVTQELAEGYYYQLMDSGELYVLSPNEVGPSWSLNTSESLLGSDLSSCQNFCNADFLVVMELVEHSNCADDSTCCVGGYTQDNPFNRNLVLRMRVKVIDVRCEVPKVILYEIFKSCYAVTTNCRVDYTNITWGNRGYSLTPCGTIHQRMIRDLSSRLEKVIWSAR